MTLVKYADFECPDCRTVHGALARLEPEADAALRFVFRHLPVVTSHPGAMQAAEAMEATGVHGRFWEMYALLFQEQENWHPGWVEGYGQELELDMDRFIIRPRRQEPRPAHLGGRAERTGERRHLHAEPLPRRRPPPVPRWRGRGAPGREGAGAHLERSRQRAGEESVSTLTRRLDEISEGATGRTPEDILMVDAARDRLGRSPETGAPGDRRPCPPRSFPEACR